jgi:ectoine hydroxylase-related dioxygenase (phytanoyl-CoA dioxygenase family)
MLTAWIPLQDTDSDSGTLMVIDGSHKWPESEHIRYFNDPDLDNLSTRIKREIPEESYIPLYLKKGQVSFHHMRLLHASGSNTSNIDRLALAVHLQDEENSYREAFSDGNLIIIPHDEICRRQSDGTPDYSDPQVFPTIWRAAQHAD